MGGMCPRTSGALGGTRGAGMVACQGVARWLGRGVMILPAEGREEEVPVLEAVRYRRSAV